MTPTSGPRDTNEREGTDGELGGPGELRHRHPPRAVGALKAAVWQKWPRGPAGVTGGSEGGAGRQPLRAALR